MSLTTADEGESARAPRWAWVLLGLYSLAVGIIGSLGVPFDGHDEPRVAGIARAMALSGDFVTPSLNGRPFLEYPPLGYVPSALFLAITGAPSHFATRLPLALFGVGSVLLTAAAATRMRGWRFGIAAGILTQTTGGFVGLPWMLVVDAQLVFFTTLSCVGFYLGWRQGSRTWAAMFWLGMAGGFLTKGAIGVAVPAAVAGAFLAALLAARRLGLTSVKVWRDVGWLWGPLLFAAPIAAWVYAVRQAGGAELASEVFRQSFTRFASKSADHAAPVWFYGDIVLYKTLPLAILLLTWLVLRRRRGSARVQGSTAFDPDVLFPIVWFVVVFAGLSVAAAKRALYLSPLLPAAGLLSAVLWTSIAPRLPIAAYVATAWVVAPLAFVVGRAATIRQYGAKDVDFAEVFEALDVNEAKPPFILYTPTEGLEGAHVYFTGRTAPVAHTPEELEQLVRADPKTLVFFEWRHSWKPAAPIVGGLTIRVLHEYEVGRNRVIVAEVKP